MPYILLYDIELCVKHCKAIPQHILYTFLRVFFHVLQLFTDVTPFYKINFTLCLQQFRNHSDELATYCLMNVLSILCRCQRKIGSTEFQISYNQVRRPEKLKVLSLLDWVRWRPGSLDLRNTLWFLSPRGRCYLGQVVRNFPHCILRWKPRVGSPALMKAYATWI